VSPPSRCVRVGFRVSGSCAREGREERDGREGKGREGKGREERERARRMHALGAMERTGQRHRCRRPDSEVGTGREVEDEVER